MNTRASVVRRGPRATARLGLTERVFATADERRTADAIDDALERVESGLVEQVRFADDIADPTTRYLLDAGGKRVRPILMLIAAQLGRGATDDVIYAAQAIEITHLGSLYHDDVMDEADRRRGVPSAQFVWGNSVAILTGDLLFARASQMMAELGERAIGLQAATFERLVLGQLHETVGPRTDEDAVAHYLRVLADKTGSLIATAARAGVIFSGADPAYEEPLRLFGERIGIAFQIVDDVIDLSPQPEETGKVPGTDLRAGVVTMPLLKLRIRARADAASAALLERIETLVIASGAHESVPGGGGAAERPAALEHSADAAVDDAIVDAVVDELRDHPVTDETLADARRWADDAVAALNPLPNGTVKKALTRFAETIVERNN